MKALETILGSAVLLSLYAAFVAGATLLFGTPGLIVALVLLACGFVFG